METTETSRFRRFLYNAALLTLTSLCTRAAGVLFNLYLTRRLGAAGLGRFSLILSVYGFGVTLATSGIHLAVTRVAAEEAGQLRWDGVCTAVRTGFLYSLCFGITSGFLLFSFAQPIARFWLHDSDTIPALRLLALSLPLLSLSTMAGGYFIAKRQAARSASAGIIGQMVRIFSTVLFLHLSPGQDRVTSCAALAGGMLCAETVTFLVSLLLFLPGYTEDRRKASSGFQTRTGKVSRYLLRIAVPIALTTYIRSGLLTLEHLLIPIGLEHSGASADDALAAYGTVHGMVLPVILFPAAFLAAFSGLLIPEIAEFRTTGRLDAVNRTVCRVLRVTMLFAVLVSGVMLCFSAELGQVLYSSAEAGRYIRILAALIPVMYLDTMVDAMLKGLDEQVASMRYNIIDTAFSVIAAWILLPAYGISGYLALLYASELLNFSLSIGKLFSVTGLSPKLGVRCIKPILSVIGATAASSLIFRFLGDCAVFRFPAVTLTVHIVFTAFLYLALLFLSGAADQAEIRRFRTLLGIGGERKFAMNRGPAGLPQKIRQNFR